MADLQRALEIAVESHKHQKQKDGTPYALHPIRLSLSLQSEEQKIVALLHNVVEDTDWTNCPIPSTASKSARKSAT